MKSRILKTFWIGRNGGLRVLKDKTQPIIASDFLHIYSHKMKWTGIRFEPKNYNGRSITKDFYVIDRKEAYKFYGIRLKQGEQIKVKIRRQ